MHQIASAGLGLRGRDRQRATRRRFQMETGQVLWYLRYLSEAGMPVGQREHHPLLASTSPPVRQKPLELQDHAYRLAAFSFVWQWPLLLTLPPYHANTNKRLPRYLVNPLAVVVGAHRKSTSCPPRQSDLRRYSFLSMATSVTMRRYTCHASVHPSPQARMPRAPQSRLVELVITNFSSHVFAICWSKRPAIGELSRSLGNVSSNRESPSYLAHNETH